LRIDESRRPFLGHDIQERVAERFHLLPSADQGGFFVYPVDESSEEVRGGLAHHSPLVDRKLTTVCPQRMMFLGRDHDGSYPASLPKAFEWAATEGEKVKSRTEEPRLIFSKGEEGRSASGNDFLIKETGRESGATAISQVLLEVMAHKRSLLFGLALASRIVNVMLPHALLTPVPPSGDGACWEPDSCRSGAWVFQPVLSLIRVARDDGDFRHMYSLTIFLIPVKGARLKARKMSSCEIDWSVNAGWTISSSPFPGAVPRFATSGPLVNYASRLVHCEFVGRRRSECHPDAYLAEGSQSYTLRDVTEKVAFAVALRMAEGSTARADEATKRRIGDGVVTALGSARVSAVTVVDETFCRKRLRRGKFPEALRVLVREIARDARIPSKGKKAQWKKCRLDRPFLYSSGYAIGILPNKRCVIIVSCTDAQHGRRESGLMQAGIAAYMTIGSATAIGTLRAIDRDLEGLEGSEPSRIATIEGEIAVDLHEIYDFDITIEGFRHRYRRLREHLGITRDYEMLQGKMKALERETTTRHEVKSQAQIMWLTAAIVLLSVLILIVTVAKG
jgi:hypothetical protein